MRIRANAAWCVPDRRFQTRTMETNRLFRKTSTVGAGSRARRFSVPCGQAYGSTVVVQLLRDWRIPSVKHGRPQPLHAFGQAGRIAAVGPSKPYAQCSARRTPAPCSGSRARTTQDSREAQDGREVARVTRRGAGSGQRRPSGAPQTACARAAPCFREKTGPRTSPVWHSTSCEQL